MKAHIFNLDNLLILINQKVWIIDKNDPKIPLIKLHKEDFDLIKAGVYKKDNISFNFNGKSYWINQDLFDELSKQVKKLSSSEQLSFSFREFTDPDTIQELKVDHDISLLKGLKDNNDEIFFVSTKGTEKKYGKYYTELIDKLKEEGIIINKVFYLNQSYFSQNKDVNTKKISFVLIKLLSGYEITDNTFGDYTKEYDEVLYYDNSEVIINKIEAQFNQFLTYVVKNTEPVIDLNLNNKILVLNKVGSNLLNPVVSRKIKPTINRLLKTYESFSQVTRR